MNAPSRFCENCGTALDPSQRFCGGCGQPSDGTAAAPTPMMSTPMSAAAVAAAPGWHMPTWAWLVMGLVFAGGVGGGLFYVSNAVSPRQPVYTKAQQDSIAKHVLDDLPDNPDGIELNKATNPTDLPPDLQKKFDNSALSEKHQMDMAEALGPLPKIGGELVDTKRAPTFADDFSDPSSGWYVAQREKSNRAYANGQLQLTYSGANGYVQSSLGQTIGDFAMQVEATPLESPANFWYGISVRETAAQSYIVFLLNTHQMYTIMKVENGKSTQIVEPFKSKAIKPGMATNVIKVYVVDKYYQFDVNGELVEVQEIDGAGAGRPGVIVVRSKNDSPDATTVAFDNVKLWVKR